MGLILKSTTELCLGGERGIRTPGTLRFNGFQDRRNRPLCHLSGAKIGNTGQSKAFSSISTVVKISDYAV